MTGYQRQEIDRAFSRWHRAHVDLEAAQAIAATAADAEDFARRQLAHAVAAAGVDLIEHRGHLIITDRARGVLVVPQSELAPKS